MDDRYWKGLHTFSESRLRGSCFRSPCRCRVYEQVSVTPCPFRQRVRCTFSDNCHDLSLKVRGIMCPLEFLTMKGHDGQFGVNVLGEQYLIHII